MSSLSIVLLGGLALLAGWIVVRSVRLLLGLSYNGIVSLGWTVFMIVPFLANYAFLNPDYRDLQGWLVGIVGGGLLLADMAALAVARYRKEARAEMFSSTVKGCGWSWRLGLGLAVLFVGLTGLHLAVTPDIPIFSLLSGGSIEDVLEKRSLFSRDMPIPLVIRYLFSFAIVLLGLPAFALFVMTRRFAFAGAILVWILFYAAAGAAKGPVVLSVMIVGGVVLMVVPQIWARRLITAGLCAGLCLLVLMPALSFRTPDGLVYNAVRMPAKGDGFYRHLGDFGRMREAGVNNEHFPVVTRELEYVMYRVFLTPVEVSARWYEYFGQYPISAVHFGRIVHDSRSGRDAHPANLVGEWFYYGNYPEHYTPQVHAYASVDADAWARFGWWGFALAVAGMMGIRLWTAVLHDRNSPSQGIFTFIALVLMAALPASTSFQALIVAQGLGVILAVAGGLHVFGWLALRNIKQRGAMPEGGVCG